MMGGFRGVRSGRRFGNEGCKYPVCTITLEIHNV